MGRTYKVMGQHLKEKYADRVFQVRLLSSSDPRFLDGLMRLRNHAPVGFNMEPSPFARILIPVGKGAPDVPWSRLAMGFVYLGSRAQFHRNTTIPGYVTDAMFRQYEQYYRVSFGRPFSNARQVDEYLQQKRWPKPY